jgi:hypothetical protein
LYDASPSSLAPYAPRALKLAVATLPGSRTAFVRSFQPYGNPVAGSIASRRRELTPDVERHFATTDAPWREDARRERRPRARSSLSARSRTRGRDDARARRNRDAIETQSRRNRHERAR